MDYFVTKIKWPEHLYNVEIGTDVTIKELAKTIQQLVGHQGNIEWDSSEPYGKPRKLMDSYKLNQLGWHAKITLAEGIKTT